MNLPLIKIEDLTKVYRPTGPADEGTEVRALDGVNLTIDHGEFVAIVGPSGSGKSTLMQILGLLDRATSGVYQLDGQTVSGLGDDELAQLRSDKIGFIFQFFNLLPRTTAMDNVALPLLYADAQETEPRARELLESVGLGSRLWHRPHQLSGGQQQRVAIARALANRPTLVFADEPTGNLSTEMTHEILNHLDQLNREGTTIVLVTHEPEVAARAHRIITIRDGKIASDERVKHNMEARATSVRKADTHAAGNSSSKTWRSQWRRFLESARMAAVALMLNKMRTALATLGIVIGIASVVAMVAIGQGAKDAISEQLKSLGTNVVSIYPINPRLARGVGNDSYRRLMVDDVNAIRAKITMGSPIKRVDAQVNGNVVVAAGAKNATTEMVGAFPEIRDMQNYHPVFGRFFTDAENQQRARVVLIGQTVLKNLFGENFNPVGSTMKINRIDFTIIGVLPAKGANSFKDRDDAIIIPLFTAMYRVLGRKSVGGISVEITDPSLVPGVIEELTDLMRARHSLREDQKNDFAIRNLNEIREIYSQTTGIISSMLASIAAVSLLVGGIGIMNVMLVAVKERTREVGLRKAIGAKRRDILSQFLIESVMIGLFGGIIGVIGGYGASHATAWLLGWPAVIPIWTVALAFFFSIVVGIVFGLWPAKQASDLSPIEALRYE